MQHPSIYQKVDLGVLCKMDVRRDLYYSSDCLKKMFIQNALSSDELISKVVLERKLSIYIGRSSEDKDSFRENEHLFAGYLDLQTVNDLH